MTTPDTYDSAERLADAVIATVGKHIVLGLPIGIGKPAHIVDALYRQAQADRSISLDIFTGLTLEKPRGGSELERRFLGPLNERLYARWPEPLYAADLRSRSLPPNVSVREFYLRPGAYLGHPLVQQSYTSVNYSQVASELRRLGVNVIAQLVGVDPALPGRYSLGSNPEVTLDLLPYIEEQRRNGNAVAVVAQANRNMPYMGGDAELAGDRIDMLLDDEALDFPLFCAAQSTRFPRGLRHGHARREPDPRRRYAAARHRLTERCGGTLPDVETAVAGRFCADARTPARRPGNGAPSRIAGRNRCFRSGGCSPRPSC